MSALSRSGYKRVFGRRLASCSLMLLLVLCTVVGGIISGVVELYSGSNRSNVEIISGGIDIVEARWVGGGLEQFYMEQTGTPDAR